VAQQHHYYLSALDFPGLLLFNLTQALVHQIKGDANDRDLVGTAPAIGQVALWPE
jgi:hypothetical protein